MINYRDDTNYIILDKSPYSEYYYQKTPCFDRNIITPYGNHKIEEEIFKYKEIMDNAIVIFLENDECWKNYEKREYSKKWKGPYYIYKVIMNGSYQLKDTKGRILRTPVNGELLKRYLSRESFEPIVLI